MVPALLKSESTQWFAGLQAGTGLLALSAAIVAAWLAWPAYKNSQLPHTLPAFDLYVRVHPTDSKSPHVIRRNGDSFSYPPSTHNIGFDVFVDFDDMVDVPNVTVLDGVVNVVAPKAAAVKSQPGQTESLREAFGMEHVRPGDRDEPTQRSVWERERWSPPIAYHAAFVMSVHGKDTVTLRVTFAGIRPNGVSVHKEICIDFHAQKPSA